MKESEKIYTIKIVGKIGKINVKSLICINDNGEHLKNKIKLLNSKYPDFVEK